MEHAAKKWLCLRQLLDWVIYLEKKIKINKKIKEKFERQVRQYVWNLKEINCKAETNLTKISKIIRVIGTKENWLEDAKKTIAKEAMFQTSTYCRITVKLTISNPTVGRLSLWVDSDLNINWPATIRWKQYQQFKYQYR